MSYIYVLHFDTRLAHAQHYIGCTDNIRGRLMAHARGAGSNLTRELIKQGITWRLASLMTCSHRHMRSLERSLKDQKHASRFCGRCTDPPAMFQGTRHYPIEQIPWPTDSVSLALTLPKVTGQTVRLSAPGEPASTMQAIVGLMRKDKDALGFVPCGGDYGIEQLVDRGLIAIAEWNGEVIGYATHTLNPSKTRTTIHQCCVRDDARLLGIGREMVNLIRDNHVDTELVAKVRTDLAANHFWSAIGFSMFQSVRHPTSKSLIHHYRLSQPQENGLWLPTSTPNTEPTNSTKTENEFPLPTSSPES